jgi:6,7-dimethyl-8-ribityllumazine synthase
LKASKITGQLQLHDGSIGLVAGRFNELVTAKLVSGAREALIRHGVDETRITEVWVPGAFEIPMAAHRMASTGRFAALVALGCVIRGATAHFDYVCSACVQGVTQVSMQFGLPVTLGVLTTDTMDQALERAGGKAGNKGADAAAAALEMADLLQRIPGTLSRKPTER